MPSANMYSDAEMTAPPPAPTEPAAPEAAEEETESSAPTAELPKSILGGKEFKPGEEVVLRIVDVGEESVTVEYATEEEAPEEGAPAEAAPTEGAPPSPGSMGSMMY